MDVELAEQKSAMRRAMSAARRGLSPDDAARRSASACRRLTGLPEFGAARVVAGFSAKAAAGEIDPAAALDAARQAGATVVLPRVSDDGQPRLRFHWVAGEGDLRPGRFGVLEPDPGCTEVAAEDIDLMVCPGLAFDAGGRRLGFGGGYYDEVTTRMRETGRATLVGLGFDFQIVERCPAGELDVVLDCVVTDTRVLRPDAQKVETAP